MVNIKCPPLQRAIRVGVIVIVIIVVVTWQKQSPTLPCTFRLRTKSHLKGTSYVFYNPLIVILNIFFCFSDSSTEHIQGLTN